MSEKKYKCEFCDDGEIVVEGLACGECGQPGKDPLTPIPEKRKPGSLHPVVVPLPSAIPIRVIIGSLQAWWPDAPPIVAEELRQCLFNLMRKYPVTTPTEKRDNGRDERQPPGE